MFRAGRSVRRWCRALPLALLALAGATTAPRAQGFGGTVADILVRGDALLAQGRPNEAMAQFQEARTLCATPAEVVQSLQGEGRANVQLSRLLPAAALFEEAATRYPDDPRAADLLMGAGQAAQRGGETERAIRLFRAALGRNPPADVLPVLKLALGQALRMTGAPQEALDLLQGFDTEFPDHALAGGVLYTRAIISQDLERWEEAATLYRGVIDRFPGTQAAIEAHFELADVLSKRHKDREAAETYRTYVSLAPGSPVAAVALERAGDLLLFRAPAEAAQLYALAQVKDRANPKHPIPTLRLGRYVEAKKFVAAALLHVWILGLLALLVAGGVFLLFRTAWRRRRRGATPAAPAPAADGPP